MPTSPSASSSPASPGPDPEGPDGSTTPAARPNLIVVCVDQMRADALGIAGNEHIDTPYLDQLGRGGFHFTKAYSATPTCVPARVALLTGKSQEAHGRYGYREGIAFPDAYPVTLPSTLRDSGYQTYAVGKMHVFPDRARCGFEDVLLHDGFLHTSRALSRGPSGAIDDYVDWLRAQTGDPRADYQETGIGCNAMTARPWEREERLHPTRWVADESFRFLQRRDPTRPFFLYMSFHRPHAPFDPPAWLWDKYRAQPSVQRPMGSWVPRFDAFRRDHEVEAEFGARKESVHHDVRASYFGNIEFIDLQINRLIEQLSDQGLLESTAIAFVSDHGEMLGDHDMYRKSVGYEGSAHIPFLLHVPPALRERTGEPRTAGDIVELRDLMPTLLDLAGVDVPDGVDGVSLLPTLREGTSPRDHLHGEHVIGSLGHHSMQWIRTPRWKYVCSRAMATSSCSISRPIPMSCAIWRRMPRTARSSGGIGRCSSKPCGDARRGTSRPAAWCRAGPRRPRRAGCASSPVSEARAEHARGMSARSPTV